MTSQTHPTIGRVVIFYDKNTPYNGHHEQPAIVTTTWGKTPGSCVNVKVLPDCSTPFDATSLRVYDSLEAGLESGDSRFVYWPPRA
jgi:hypothetical protein